MSEQEGSRVGHWRRLRSIYRAVFLNDAQTSYSHAGAMVIANLRELSNFDRSAFTPDPYRMAHNVGKQDVVKHILQMINLTDEEIARLDATAAQEFLNGESEDAFIS